MQITAENKTQAKKVEKYLFEKDHNYANNGKKHKKFPSFPVYFRLDDRKHIWWSNNRYKGEYNYTPDTLPEHFKKSDKLRSNGHKWRYVVEFNGKVREFDYEADASRWIDRGPNYARKIALGEIQRDGVKVERYMIERYKAISPDGKVTKHHSLHDIKVTIGAAYQTIYGAYESNKPISQGRHKGWRIERA